MRMKSLGVGFAVFVTAALTACGQTATTSHPASATPSMSPSASATASPTPPSGVLEIPQLGLSMTIPTGLSGVTYQLVAPGFSSLDDHSGVPHKPLGQIQLSTNDCPGGATILVTLWDVNPADLSGQGYGGTVPGSDTQVGNRYLHIEAGDGFPPPNCSSATTSLLQQLVASASAS